MGNITVCKYGGTSVDSPEDMDLIRRITEDDARRRVIVVSAPAGVTDLLIRLTGASDHAILSQIVQKYVQAHPKHADPEFIQRSLVDRLECALPGAERTDYVKAFGEYMNAKLIAEILGYEFVDAADMLDVTSCFGNADIEPSSADKVRNRLNDPKKRYVVPGFYGRTAKGSIATFSRGGSDLTGAYLAAAIYARVYENITDRKGVYTADPKIVAAARKINALTFKEMRDLAYSGAKIFHPDAVLPIEDALENGSVIKVHVRSAMCYPEEGTFIVSERPSDPSQPVVGLAYGDSFCSFDLSMRGMNNKKGLLADVTAVFKDMGLSIEHTTTGIDDLSVILKKEQIESDITTVSDVKSRLMNVLGSRGTVQFQENMGCLVVAGKGIRRCSTKTTRRMLQALEDERIEAIFTQKGPSQSCIITGIPSEYKELAIHAVHQEFFGK